MNKLISLLLLALLLFSCNKSNNATNGENKNGGKIIKRISLEESKKLIENRKSNNIIIIDIRTPQEYQAEHLVDAINIDFYKNFKENINKLDKNKKYFIYCRSANRSRSALIIMKDLNFKSVLEMDEGIKVWVRNGWSVIK